MAGKIVSFARRRQELEQAAYEWAINDLKHYLEFDPRIRSIRLKYDKYDHGYDIDKRVRSLFIDKETGKALYRIDWPDESLVVYFILTNLSEMVNEDYLLVKQLVRNGIRVCRYYGGPRERRRPDKPFPYRYHSWGYFSDDDEEEP